MQHPKSIASKPLVVRQKDENKSNVDAAGNDAGTQDDNSVVMVESPQSYVGDIESDGSMVVVNSM